MVIGSISTFKFSNGKRIVGEGDSGSLLYIIKEGIVTCSQGNQIIRTLNAG